MPTRPDPEQSDEGPALEPIRVLRPRRTDALAELFKELERDRNGYEAVPVPPSLSGTEDATQELPPVADERRIAPLGSGARPRPAVSGGPGFRRTAIAVAVTAAAVVGFGGALLLSGRGDDAAAGARDTNPTASASASAEPAPNAPGGPGADDSGDSGDSGGAGGSSACTASFRTVNSWQGGYQGEVTVTNAPATSVSGWTATVVPDDGARLTQVWDGTLTTTRDGTATVANASWNGRLAPGASVTFGFIADTSESGAPSAQVTCAATAGSS